MTIVDKVAYILTLKLGELVIMLDPYKGTKSAQKAYKYLGDELLGDDILSEYELQEWRDDIADLSDDRCTGRPYDYVCNKFEWICYLCSRIVYFKVALKLAKTE